MRTFYLAGGMSQKGHKRTHATQRSGSQHPVHEIHALETSRRPVVGEALYHANIRGMLQTAVSIMPATTISATIVTK
jgi:hypothetical protein